MTEVLLGWVLIGRINHTTIIGNDVHEPGRFLSLCASVRLLGLLFEQSDGEASTVQGVNTLCRICDPQYAGGTCPQASGITDAYDMHLKVASAVKPGTRHVAS